VDQKKGVVCHLGASQSHKVWPAERWITLLNRVVRETGREITIVGGKEEFQQAHNIALQVGAGVKVLAGITSFNELLDTIHKAELFIGGDSGPLHAASLAGTRSLNLSVGNVRFWETGPLTPGSRVVVSRDPTNLASDRVFEQVRQML